MDLSSREGRRQLGERIQTAADAAGLSLAELAQAIGCSRALIYQYVSGQVLAQADRLQAVGDRCGRPLAWFFDLEAEPASTPMAPVPAAPPPVRRDDLRALLAAQSGPADFGAAQRTSQALRDLAAESGDPAELAAADSALGHASWQAGDLEAARAALQRSADAYAQLGDADRELNTRQSLGAALAGLGERDRALREFDLVTASGDPSLEWRGRLGRADVLESLGQGEAALAELDRAAEVVGRLDGVEQAWAKLYLDGALTNVYLLHDDYEQAAATARAAAPLAEELAAVDQHLEALLNLAVVHRGRYDLPAAAAALDQVIRLARLTGDRERWAVALALRAELEATLGRAETARESGRDALRFGLEVGSVRAEWLAHLALSAAALVAGEGQEAWHQAQQAVAVASAHRLVKGEAVAWLAAVEARLLLGHGAPALPDARRVVVTAERLGARTVLGWGQLCALRCQGSAEECDWKAPAQWADQTGAAELAWRTAAERAVAVNDPSAAEVVIQQVAAWRETWLAAGLEEAWLDDRSRLTLVRRCLTLLDPEARMLWLDALAWPPLADERALGE